MTRTALSTTLALAVLGLAACGGGKDATPAPATPATPAGDHAAPAADAKGPLVKPGDAKPGDKTTCPISGEEFVVDASSPHTEYNGKTYYFCCAGCKKKFESDPAKYSAPKS